MSIDPDLLDFTTLAAERGNPRTIPTPPEVRALPDEDKRRLCEQVLSSLGVARWRANGKGEMVHSCPLPDKHGSGDRRPSASLNFRTLAFNCLGCGSSGGLLWLIASCRQVSSQEALEWVKGETGVGGEGFDPEVLMRIIEAAFARPEVRQLPRYAPETLDRWLAWTTPHPYLTDAPTADPPGRGVPAQTLWDFSVGYAPDYQLRDVTTGALITQERVVIPLFWRGQLVGWQARAIFPGDEPKYHNSPDFPRDVAAFNYSPRRRCVLVESPMSVLRHYHHVPDMISTYGAALSPEQIRLLRRHDQVILWLDNDSGGWDGTRRILDELPSYADVRVVTSDYDADPADLPDHLVETLVASAIPWSIWEPPDRLRPKEMIPA